MHQPTTRVSLWPKTYLERGAVVPFTTPVLAFSRARATEKGKELLVPGLSGGQGIYVIPWPALREIFRMTVHDRALHEHLAATEGASPADIRGAALQVAQSGLAGPGSRQAAGKKLDEDDNSRLLAHFHLMTRALAELAPGAPALDPADLTSGEGQRRTKERLSGLAQRFGTTADQLYARLERWSTIVAPLGLPGVEHQGRLRRLVGGMRGLTGRLDGWIGHRAGDPDGHAGLCRGICAGTVEHVDRHVAAIDGHLARIGDTLRDWSRSEWRLIAGLDRVTWLVDGWEYLLAMWDEAEGKVRHEQQTALAEMARVVPLVPREEVDAAAAARWAEMADGMRKSLRPLDGWNAGSVDLELMLRIEAFKASAA